MDIFDFALQMEKDGKRFYQDAAARCGDKGLQAVFNLLADAEQEHYDLVKSEAGHPAHDDPDGSARRR